MKEKLKNKKGITLIALIITIIILLILTVVSIQLIINGGIVSKAEKGANEYSKSEADEQAQLLQAEYEMAKYEGKTTGSFTDYILDTKYNGAKIGDTVNYDEGIGFTYTTDTSKGIGGSVGEKDSTTGKYLLNEKTYTTQNLTWVILGVTKSGELELISCGAPDTVVLTNEEGYLYGPEELNKMCNELYGKGLHAREARSLNVEDLNRLSAYNPESSKSYGEKWQYEGIESGKYRSRYSKDNGKNWSQYTYSTNSGTGAKFRAPRRIGIN